MGAWAFDLKRRVSREDAIRPFGAGDVAVVIAALAGVGWYGDAFHTKITRSAFGGCNPLILGD